MKKAARRENKGKTSRINLRTRHPGAWNKARRTAEIHNRSKQNPSKNAEQDTNDNRRKQKTEENGRD